MLAVWRSNSKETEYTVLWAYCNPTAYFKDMSWNLRGQLLIRSLNESSIDNWTLQNALLCFLTLKLSAAAIFPGDVISREHPSLMFETLAPPWAFTTFAKPRLAPLCGEPAKSWRFLRPPNVNANEKIASLLIWDEVEQVPEQEQVRCSERRAAGLHVSSLYCAALPAKPSVWISHWGLPNPQHLSRFTTLTAESWRVWRARRSSLPRLNCFQTSPSAVICNFAHLLIQFICPQFTPTNHRCVLRYLCGNIYIDETHMEPKERSLKNVAAKSCTHLPFTATPWLDCTNHKESHETLWCHVRDHKLTQLKNRRLYILWRMFGAARTL